MKNDERKLRSFLDPIVLSTLPHFFTLGLVVYSTQLSFIFVLYSVVVFISTTLSIVWHLQFERKTVWFWLDYTFAFLWTLIEIFLAFEFHITQTIILLNVVVFVLNQVCEYAVYGRYYDQLHSIWHLISSVKAAYVAHLILSRRINKN